MQNRKGFTLIELLIVVVIIGILAAIAIPKFSSVKQKGYKTQAIAEMQSLKTAEETFFTDSNRYGAITELTELLRSPSAVNVHELKVMPVYFNLRGDPRFQALLNDPKNNAPLF